MIRPHLALGLALAWLALTGVAPAGDGGSFRPSKELAALLEARGEDGEPVVAASERAYFDALPTRAKELFEDAIDAELMSEPAHLHEILALGLAPPKLELLMSDNCVICHTDPEEQDPETLFSANPEAHGSPSHLDLVKFASDVHLRRGLSCSGCHGGSPDDDDMADEIYERWPEAPERYEDRTWIPRFCARCHADPAFMRNFDPDLPTDQYAKYEESRHGQLLLDEGDSRSAQCVSCHGVHGILGPDSPRSSVYARNVPSTCGACHADPKTMKGYRGRDGEPLPTDQLEAFEGSVHGRALLEKGDLGAPACNDCHGNHAAMPPAVSSVAQVCRTCHVGNGELFDGSRHKEAFERNGWPECETCHGDHAVAETDDSMLDETANPLCYDCHEEHARDNPKCEETARYFHTSLTELASATASLEGRIEPLAEQGLDVDPLTQNVEALHDILRQSRMRIHAFDRSEFEKLAESGHETVAAGRQDVEEAEAEHRFRLYGMLGAIAIMALLALLLLLKIRQLESRSQAPGRGPRRSDRI